MVMDILTYFVPGYIALHFYYNKTEEKKLSAVILYSIVISYIMRIIVEFFDYIFSPNEQIPIWLTSAFCVGLSIIFSVILPKTKL